MLANVSRLLLTPPPPTNSHTFYSKYIFASVYDKKKRKYEQSRYAEFTACKNTVEVLACTAFVAQLNCDDVASRQGLNLT